MKGRQIAMQYPLTPTVFVINDCTKGRELTRLLEISGCHVLEECNVKNAIEKALDFTLIRKPDLILINLNSVINEYPLAIRLLREGSDFGNVPIVAILDSMMEELVEEALAMGCDDFILDPIDLEHTKKLLNYLTPKLSEVAA